MFIKQGSFVKDRVSSTTFAKRVYDETSMLLMTHVHLGGMGVARPLVQHVCIQLFLSIGQEIDFGYMSLVTEKKKLRNDVHVFF